jgi:transposase-like protein
MRYPAAEKLEIIRLVEQSHLPVRQTLAMISIPPATFYRWYDRYLEAGPEGLEDRRPRPRRIWNRTPDEVRQRILDLAIEVPELSPRELAVRFTDTGSVLRVRSFRLPAAQGTRPDHQPGLHRGQGRAIGTPLVRETMPPTSSVTRPPSRTSSGRPTSPTSR